MRTALGALYLIVFDRDPWQKAIIGGATFLLGGVLGPTVHDVFQWTVNVLASTVAPQLVNLRSPVSLDGWNLLFVVSTLGYSVYKFNRIEDELGSVSQIRTDGGTARTDVQAGSDPDERPLGTGEGAVVGGIGGAIVGATVGPTGVLVGVVVGALAGDTLERRGRKSARTR